MRLLFLLSLLLVCALPLAQAQCYTTYRDLGKEAAAKGRYDEALKQYDKALECASDKPANANTEIKNLKSEARRKKKDKADDDAWDTAKSAKSASACQKYLDTYPSGRHAADARQCLNDYGDTDGDGVVNINDRCPNEQGTIANNGCLEIPIPEMVFIQGGTFLMGSTDSGDDDPPVPVHTVNVGDFYLGKYEVTNREYCAFLNEKGNQIEGGRNWISIGGGIEGEKCRISQSGNTFSVENGYENYPVIYVKWYGAKVYTNWLSAKTGKKYRLPTEAEWEYAAGNGSRHTKYSWGNGPPYGKQGGNVADETFKTKFPNSDIFTGYTDGYVYAAPVGQFNANDFGLHDMSGNVREWCEDTWHNSYRGAPTDGSAWLNHGDQSGHISRGGDWSNFERLVRVSCRSIYHPADIFGYYGFRIAQDK